MSYPPGVTQESIDNAMGARDPEWEPTPYEMCKTGAERRVYLAIETLADGEVGVTLQEISELSEVPLADLHALVLDMYVRGIIRRGRRADDGPTPRPGYWNVFREDI